MKKVYFETYGCSLNHADTLLMKGLLKRAGYAVVDNEKDAEIVVVNTCTVKQPTEKRIIRRIQSIKGKKVVATGCLVQVNPELFRDCSVIGCEAVKDIVKAVRTKLRKTGRKRVLKLNVVPLRRNEAVEIIPISQGCLGSCSYCQTKLARGRLYSYDEDDILRHAKSAVESGAKELWLTSQDTGCYGFDKGTNLAKLLKNIVKIRGDFRVRVGMMNPNHAKEILKELLDAYDNEKIFKFLHVPVQSGSDAVLKAMNRNYTASGFKNVVEAFKKRYPNITVSTDIICGYPTETKEDFEKTVMLLEWLRPTVLNFSRFWPRKGTKAAGLKQIETKELKRRTSTVASLFKKIAGEEHRKYEGKIIRVLVDGKNSARTDSYKKVVITGGKIGEFCNALVTRTTYTELWAKKTL